ncbi:MAG TPA: TIR domain-containing protein [Chitinophagales bacterium]|nr:TIR domain-containing protein [Chitinophagales bacterium]
MPDTKLNLFIAYAAEDVHYCSALRTHLAALERSGYVQIWYDGKIEAGQDWEASMVNQLEMADLVLLLVSADFIQSDVCYQTIFPVAIRLQKSGQAKVVPVIVRQCIWESTPLARMLPLPKNGIPPENKEVWQTPDECYTQIAYEVGQLVKDALLSRGVAMSEMPASMETKPKKQHRQGKVLYLVPGIMEVQKKYPCFIRIAPEDIDLKTLKERLKNVDEAVIENIRIDSIMKAEIIDDTDGEAFDIDRIGELEQPIEEESYTEWRYNITPLKQGTYSLCIKVSVMLRVPDLGKFVFKDVVVLDRDVVVTTYSQPPAQQEWAVAKNMVPFAATGLKSVNENNTNNSTNLLRRIVVAALIGFFIFPAFMWAFMAEWVAPLYLSAAYDDYRQLHDERIAVKKNGKWGFVNKWGIQSTPPVYETVEDFNNAVSMVSNPNQPPRQLHRDTSQGWLAGMFNPRDYLSINPCQNITCQNGGKCVNGKCQCPNGFTGKYCETKQPNTPNDPCQNITCQNGGKCVNGKCQCPNGFTGKYCETKQPNTPNDPCQNITCQNGGKCVNGKCQCPNGFTGKYCETKQPNTPNDPCQNITCQNGGKCVNGKCQCPNGFTGKYCETKQPKEEDICKQLRCSANGVCNPITKKCDCNPGYTGTRCQLYEGLCPIDCKPNGKCNPQTKKCDCNPGYTGERCEKQDPCYNKNCNAGTCNPRTGKCVCPEGYTGQNCEQKVTADPCSQKPDLVITNFTVKSVSPARSQTLGYRVAFTAIIKNTGGADASACNLLAEYSQNNENQFFYGNCQPFAALNAKSERTISGTLTISGIGTKSAQIRLLIDATCSEEFLPVYVKVDECNENNNYSAVKTVAF